MHETGDIALAGGGRLGWMERTLRAQRQRLDEAFLLFRRGAHEDSVLDVGLAPMRRGAHEGMRTPYTPCMLEATRAPFLPWSDASFDWVHCADTMEYLAQPSWQQALVTECYRVARKGVFISTPNRNHPFEFHSGLPLLHRLPHAWRPALARVIGAARRMPPALVDAPRLYALAAALPGCPAHDVGHKRVLGIKAHFFLMIRKED